MYHTFKQIEIMTIQVNITKTDLKHKLQICKSLAQLISFISNDKVFDYSRFVPSLIYIQKEIESSGNYTEIWDNLTQLEKDLLQLV